MSRFELTLGPARALLVGRRRVGYAGPVPNDRLMNVGYGRYTWRYFLVQYVVAPVVVSRAPGVTPLIADLPDQVQLATFARAHGYVVRWQHGGLGVLDAP